MSWSPRPKFDAVAFGARAVARAVARTRRERWECMLDQQVAAVGLRRQGLAEGVREFRFDERAPGLDRDGRKLPRGWRFDRAWPAERLAVEVEGVTFEGGRHQRKRGFEDDADKYLEAQRQGWTVLRVTPRQLRQGTAILALEELLRRHALSRRVAEALENHYHEGLCEGDFGGVCPDCALVAECVDVGLLSTQTDGGGSA